MKEKPWPQKGDTYYFLSDDLCVCSDTVTGKELPDKFHKQIVRLFAFETVEDAKEMVDILMSQEKV